MTFEPSPCDIFDGRSGNGRRVAIMDFGAPLTIGEAYLKIIMSSFLGFCEWNTRNRWRDGQETKRPEKKRANEKKKRKRARKREGLIVGGRGEEKPRVLLGDADQESETRMRKNALRTGRRQFVELRKGDLLEVARELGVDVNGNQTRVEIKEMILQNDKNDMEAIKAVMEGILEGKLRSEDKLGNSS
ncbi:hypothetical protein TNCV_3768181 [Trichonephila clavipes]|nr:hypothetical protein TNCV_3768181 [Trichonephila clavipes]